MKRITFFAATFSMLWVFVSHMVPATLTHDSTAIIEAARLTNEQLPAVFTTFAEEELKTIPIDSLVDAFSK
jgi:hypothetical protein